MSFFMLKNGEIRDFNKMEMMGIVNVTPDSFFAGSRTLQADMAVRRAEQMIEEGATFIDVGGESTRPGAEPVTPDQEADRICPVISRIKQAHPDILLSADTYREETAKRAIESGADLINDISGLTFDKEMAQVISEAGVPVIIMHINGRPDHMQDNPQYEDVVEDVFRFLAGQIDYAVRSGIEREKIIIDLGIGFGKNYEHNITLLKNIDRFRELDRPHLLAVSRKSFIGTALGRPDPADRLTGTAAVTAYAALHGIEIARVHDVRENLDAARMMEALK